MSLFTVSMERYCPSCLKTNSQWLCLSVKESDDALCVELAQRKRKGNGLCISEMDRQEKKLCCQKFGAVAALEASRGKEARSEIHLRECFVSCMRDTSVNGQ